MERTAEFSLLIGPEHRGRGLGKATLEAWLQYGFKELNLDLIWGETFIYPMEAATLIPEKSQYLFTDRSIINPAYQIFKSMPGYKQEGRLRKRYRKFGYSVDSLVFSFEKL